MTVYVLRTPLVDQTLEFFEQLGLTFVQEKHGQGPVHYACEQNGNVFEIYPSRDGSVDGEFHKG